MVRGSDPGDLKDFFFKLRNFMQLGRTFLIKKEKKHHSSDQIVANFNLIFFVIKTPILDSLVLFSVLGCLFTAFYFVSVSSMKVV